MDFRFLPPLVVTLGRASFVEACGSHVPRHRFVVVRPSRRLVVARRIVPAPVASLKNVPERLVKIWG